MCLVANFLIVSAASNGPANYQFNYSVSPFTFAVARANNNGQALFNTVGSRLIMKVWKYCVHTDWSTLI